MDTQILKGCFVPSTKRQHELDIPFGNGTMATQLEQGIGKGGTDHIPISNEQLDRSFV